MNQDLAAAVMKRIDALAQISEEPDCLTRTFCSREMHRAHQLVESWMREAGMSVRRDAVGNLIGSYPAKATSESSGSSPRSTKAFLLGSHLDTVRNAGKFDGALGVLIAIACVHRLHAAKIQLPFGLEVVGFADEEGVRFQSTYLGSRVLAGTFNSQDLARADANQITMADALSSFGCDPQALSGARMDPDHLLGYAEVHIEQGPVLEQKDLAVGVVSAIAGQIRASVTFTGQAGHAGTTPMNLRKDALCAAAEFVLGVEMLARSRPDLVATVGELTTLAGASNVIPGKVRLSLDVRHPENGSCGAALDELEGQVRNLAAKRNLTVDFQIVQQTNAVNCDLRLSSLLAQTVKRHQREVLVLPSGAGHDAAALAAITPVAMLFVRCRGGISHHPDEFASESDVRVAIEIMNDFLDALSVYHNQANAPL